ncbi:MAG: GNAT family N-acetyltransferase [Bacteroidota bacterium]|nr:GNAT family N-acetyltransferase [Bacteroidota bacterium]
MKIKQASFEDLETAAKLFDLYRQFYEQSSDISSAKKFLSERINNNESVIFIAMDEEKNKGMGFVQLYPSFSSVSMKKQWILNDLFIHEDHRKEGIAEALINESKKFAKKTNAKGIILETHKTNADAQRLYDKIGFIKDDEHFNYYLKVSK